MKSGWIVRTLTTLTVAFLVLPTIVVIGASFSNGDQIAFPPEGFTLRWYGNTFGNTEVWRTLINSLYVGLIAVGLTTFAAVPAVLALTRYPVRGRALIVSFLSVGLATPYIVSAVAFLVIFSELQVIRHLTVLGVALAVGTLPLMLGAVASAAQNQNPELEHAAATLGADRPQQFLFVTLPSLMPGILTGALLVFVLSITEFIVSVMLVNINNQTLPVFVYSGIRVTTSPFLAAVAVLLILVTMTIFAIVLRIGKIEQFLYRR
jgi:putative spermidine/putrescine transport system permease protein